MGKSNKSNKKNTKKNVSENVNDSYVQKELDEYKDFARKINKVISNIAKGNLNVNVEGAYDGEMKSIQDNVNSTVTVLQNLLSEADMLKTAAIEGKLETRANAKQFKGDFKEFVNGINGTLDAVIGPLNVAAEYVDRISAGDVPEEITDNYNGDFNEIKNNLNKCIRAVNGLVDEAGKLTDAAVAGKLETRGDPSKFGGKWAGIVSGVNDCLDAVIGPLNVTAEYVDRISKGDIPEKITDDYNGDFNEIKNNLNACIDVMNGLLDETDKLIDATIEGKLETRGDAEKFEGGWGKLVGGVNDLVEAFVKPINVTAEYVDNISKGVIPEEITDTYNGDFNKIKNNLNSTVKMMRELLEETDKIATAAEEGKLETRADASLFQGGWNQLVSGVNGTLDNVIGPLNVTAEYVDRISAGDIPEEITDEYKGDFNEVKNNLNKCIRAVNGLVDEASMLTDAAVEGKLETRGDSDKFGGKWAGIVTGVNGCLDAVIGPLNVTAEYVDRISAGDIPEEITDEYKGDFNEVKNNLNKCIRAVNGLVDEASMLTDAAVEGKLETRGDSDKFGGKWAGIVSGVNDCLDAVIGPLNVTAEYVDRISKGDIPEKITDDYNGDFNEIKNNLNACIDVMNGLLDETDKLIDATKEGALQTRGDADKFEGGWGKLVGGVNDLIEAFVKPINVTADYVDKISKGVIPDEITDEYKGDFNKIKGNLNSTVKMMRELLEETDKIATAAVEGKLETRANADLFQGGWNQLVGGVNQTLDRVIEPVNEAAGILDYLAKGDLTHRVTGDYKGDHAKIKNSLNQTIDSLTEKISNINDNTGILSSSAEEMSSSAEEVNASVEQTSSTVQQMAEGANSAAEQSNTVIEETKKAGKAAEEGQKASGEVSSKMSVIKTTTEEGAQKISALGEKSKEIGKIVDTINQISEQTNLLALNAAIEAARAGEAGRGFAVVADEVRKLAEESGDATQQINDLIVGIQGEIEDSVKSMDQNTRQVEEGSQGVEDAVKAFEALPPIVQAVDAAANEVASAAQQNASGSEEASSAMQEISASMQQVASGAQELTDVAMELSSIVNAFKIDTSQTQDNTTKKASANKADAKTSKKNDTKTKEKK